MSGAVVSDPAARALVREAASWRLAGLLLRTPRADRRPEVAALAREVGDAELSLAAEAGAAAGEGPYHALCGPGGPVSPREVTYRPLEDPGRLLAEVAAFHEAFAYRESGEDPRDHVAVAADFVSYLLVKEVWAAGAGRAVELETTRAARLDFVARHVRPLARGMLRRIDAIGDAPEGAYLVPALRVLARMAGADAADAPDSPFPLPGLDDATFDCGTCGGDCSIPRR